MQIQFHANQIADVMSRYAASGSSLSMAALAGSRQFTQWQHYPADDVIDTDHGTEFYYHSHPVDSENGETRKIAGRRLKANSSGAEHGHFHVFCRSSAGRRFHHLVGISMNERGLPTRLFLTNQWVTGETWIGANQACAMRSRFECTAPGRLAPVARWITAMVHFYGDEIDDLHLARQQWVTDRAFNGPERHRLLQSRDFHVIAQTPIDLIVELKNCLD